MDSQSPEPTITDGRDAPLITGRWVPRAPAASEERRGLLSRRTFSKRAASVVMGISAGAAGLAGSLVGFTPAASAASDVDCVGALGLVSQSCYGGWSNFESVCDISLLWQCVCECTGDCGPIIFRAHGIWTTQTCCCNY
jgi:hypothetical protein